MKNLSFYLIVGLALTGGVLAFANPFDLPLVYAQVSENPTISEIKKEYNILSFGNSTYQYVPHFPYFEDELGNFMPYRLTETSEVIQIEVNDGKIVFDKNTGGSTIFKNGTSVINSDSYIVRASELNTDNWFNLSVNDSPIQTIIEQNDESITVTIRRQNNEGTFDIEYVISELIKTTAKFTNQQYPNHKFAFTQTVDLPQSEINFNGQEINLNDYVGQTFPREVLIQNQDLIIGIKNIYYGSGLGFENLWSVGIFENNKIALDYANVEQTQTEIGQTVELDPTYSLGVGTHYNKWQVYSYDKPTGGNGSCNNFSIVSFANYGYQVALPRASVACHFFVLDINMSNFPYAGNLITGMTFTWDQNQLNNGGPNIYIVKLPQSDCVANANTLKTSVQTAPSWSYINLSSNTQVVTYDLANYWVSTALSDIENAVDNGDSLCLAFWANNFSGQGYSGVYEKSVVSWYGPTLKFTYTVPPPDEPTGLTITQDTNGELDLTWTAPASGTTPTAYKIDRSTDGTNFTTLTANTGTTATSYTDTTATSINTLYYYRVYSYDSGNTAYSTNYASNSETTWDVPAQVTGLTATGGNPISLSWSVPASDDTITNYKVYRDTVFLKTVVGTSTTDNPPSFGTSYSYTVSAVSPVGEGLQSTSSSATYGNPPDPPTSVSTSINNVNTNPLDVLISYSSPTNIGSGTLTGFEIVRDGSVVATVGLVTSYTDTVTSAGTYTYLVRAISTHGTSSDSNTSNITTPTEPSAINNLSATVNTDEQVSLSWSSPSNGGSSITGFIVHQDGVQIATPTSTSYTVTGLTPNTSYTFTVYAVNNVGTSLVSNSETVTTYLSVTGQIDVTTTVQGASAKIEFLANVTSGTPTPTFSNYILKQGTTTIASGITSPYILKITNPNLLNYTISSTASTHWNTPTISGSTNIQPDYTPNWENGVSYNIVRTTNNLDLFVNRDLQTNWNLTCNYVTTGQILADETGVNGTITSDWYFDDSQAIGDTNTVYIECIDDGVTVLSLTEYNTNRIGGGIALLDNIFSEWTGTPVALFFVLLVAGLFSGRSAPAGILLVLAIVGVLGFIGLLVIDELIWAFILLAGILGIFMGKRFL